MGVSGLPGFVDKIPAWSAVIQVDQEGQFVVQTQLTFHEELEKFSVAVALSGFRLFYHRFCCID